MHNITANIASSRWAYTAAVETDGEQETASGKAKR